MKIKNIILMAAALAAATSLGAQPESAGRLIRMSDFSIGDMMQFSQQSYSFGTARSAAMGGAFASLGADLSSMTLNPAGLGMYRSSEFSFSPSLTWTKTQSSGMERYQTTDENRYTRFTMGNVGVAFNVFQSTGNLTSLTFGFAYNKLADFNYNSNIGLLDQDYSVNDVFQKQLTGFPASSLSVNANPWANVNIPVNAWGAVLGYQCATVDPTDDLDPQCDTYYSNIYWGATTNNMLRTNTVGRVGEYDFALGMNFGNQFYVGLTMGIQDIYYRERNYFQESYYTANPPDPSQTDEYAYYMRTLSYFDYGQYRQYSGTGFNLKVGMIWRPIEELRMGLAIHTPTWVALDQEYQVYDMFRRRVDGDYLGDEAFSDYAVGDYNYSSPPRLVYGLSYQIGQIALLTADYECVWYNAMRLGRPEGVYVPQEVRDMVKADVKYSFRPANNVRFGVEIKPLPALALRAGYAYYDSGISDKSGVVPSNDTPVSKIDSPMADHTNNISAGVGYRVGGFSLDLAYVFSKTDYTQYALFWYDNPGYGIPDEIFGAGPVNSSMKRNIVTLTAGFRF